MSHHSGLAHALLAGSLFVTFGTGAALAQTATPAEGAAAGTAAPPEQPRRARERRRSAERAEAATPAAQVTDAAPAALPTHTADVIDERIVCKNVKLTGTNISRRICGTPEQWAAQNKKTTDDAQEAMRQVRERSSIVVTQPGNQPGGLGGGN